MMGKVLEIVYRTLATHLGKKAGFNKRIAHTGAVTLIQRFGRSGVPVCTELEHSLSHAVSLRRLRVGQIRVMRFHHVTQFPEKKAGDNVTTKTPICCWIPSTNEDDVLSQLQGHSITSATAPALLYLLHPCSRTVLRWGHFYCRATALSSSQEKQVFILYVR